MAPCPDLPWAWGGRLASGPFGIKGFGYFFHINILILIVFNVKILLKKRQLKSSDSSSKKAGSNRKRPFYIDFIYFL